MKTLPVLVIVAVVVTLALPAEASSPSRVARLTQELVALRAKVEKLSAANRKLVRANKTLREDNKNLNVLSRRLLRRQVALEQHVVSNDPCPITHPNGSEPPGPTFGGPLYEGNGSLWVGLGNSNVVVWEPDGNGVISMKFGWWRGVVGRLQIAGRRLDAPAAPLTADIPDGYGESGFQATSINFPSSGCWRVTGSVGEAILTFVTLVIAS